MIVKKRKPAACFILEDVSRQAYEKLLEVFADREVFISYEAATRGVEIENTGSEPMVGPDVHKKVPMVGDAR